MVDDPETEIAGRLLAEERLLWWGRPSRRVPWDVFDVFLIPFGLFWCVFALGCEAAAIINWEPLPAFCGIPFFLFACWLLAGRFWADARQRRQTIYAVTNIRIIILFGRFGRYIKSQNLRTMKDVSVIEKRDGSGTIIFGSTSTWSRWRGAGWPGWWLLDPLSFDNIPNVRAVCDTIVRAQAAARVTGTENVRVP